MIISPIILYFAMACIITGAFVFGYGLGYSAGISWAKNIFWKHFYDGEIRDN